MALRMAESFWTWAVERYSRDGVAALCLALQDDHDQNVPLLLWAAWGAAHGVRIAGHVERAADVARVWSQAAIIPLRTIRRRLKTTLHEGDDADRLALRETVKTAELAAERALMSQLESLAVPGDFIPVSGLVDSILAALLATSGAWTAEIPVEGLTSLTQALTKTEILGYNG